MQWSALTGTMPPPISSCRYDLYPMHSQMRIIPSIGDGAVPRSVLHSSFLVIYTEVINSAIDFTFQF